MIIKRIYLINIDSSDYINDLELNLLFYDIMDYYY